MKLGVLASHEGTILQAVIDAFTNGLIPGTLTVVISNNSSSGALRRARAATIHTEHISSRTHPHPDKLDAAIRDALLDNSCDWVLLSGYMKRLGPAVLSTYAGHIVNTHPSLLPQYGGQGFYGRRVHEAVLAVGDRISGVTAHQVTGDYDTGAVIDQTTVPVLDEDTAETLEQRVKTVERRLIVDVLVKLANQQTSTQGSPPASTT
jgi:phosphoribosylglycinamide formyltransferase-1